MLNSLSLGEELVSGLLDGGDRQLVIHVEALDDLEFSGGGGHGHGEDEALGDAVGLSVAEHAHRLPLAASGSPVPHVVDGGVSGRGCGGGSSEVDDLGASLLHAGGEFIDLPGLLDEAVDGLAGDGGVPDVGVHGGGVVAPDAHLLDIGDLGAGLEGDLSEGSVVVQSRHGREVLLGDALGVVLEDEAVGVGGVSDHDGLAVSLGVVRHGLADAHEDLSVVLEQVGSLHAGSSGLGANHEGVVDVLEADGGVAGAHDVVEEGEGAVVELSPDSGESLLGEGEVDEVEDDSLLLSEELARSQSEEDGVGDVSGGSGDGDSLGRRVANSAEGPGSSVDDLSRHGPLHGLHRLR
mmetsp:Transcript_11023/g.18425  ORF Transcript_11023/g.18425 Transcript_11023/m.18425 type:complete len:351 (-) Transcript_11023:26-1078(-)